MLEATRWVCGTSPTLNSASALMLPFSVALNVRDAIPSSIPDCSIGSNSTLSDALSGKKYTKKILGCSGVPSNWINLMVMVAIPVRFTMRTGLGTICSLSAIRNRRQDKLLWVKAPWSTSNMHTKKIGLYESFPVELHFCTQPQKCF